MPGQSKQPERVVGRLALCLPTRALGPCLAQRAMRSLQTAGGLARGEPMKRAISQDAWCGLIAVWVLASGCGAPPEARTEDESEVETVQQDLSVSAWNHVPGAAHDVATG